jgi:hypothetical protein
MAYLGNAPTSVPLTSADITDGIITGNDIASTFDLTGKTVTLPAGVGGKVLQVVTATKLGTQTITGSGENSPETFTDVTDLSLSITPSSTSNKILILSTIIGCCDNGSSASLFRGSTHLANPTSPSTRTPSLGGNYFNSSVSTAPLSFTITYLDSPSTTSATTYKIGAFVWGTATIYINRGINDTDTGYIMRGVSTITALEIAG